jgi:hypothetical protein
MFGINTVTVTEKTSSTGKIVFPFLVKKTGHPAMVIGILRSLESVITRTSVSAITLNASVEEEMVKTVTVVMVCVVGQWIFTVPLVSISTIGVSKRMTQIIRIVWRRV